MGLLLGVILVGVEFLTFLAFGADLPGNPSGWITYDAVSIFPVTLWSLLLVVTLAAMTRALHIDGFMDSCDALLGGFDRERRLSILRDPHVGAFAVVGVVCLLLLKLYALSGLPIDGFSESADSVAVSMFVSLGNASDYGIVSLRKR